MNCLMLSGSSSGRCCLSRCFRSLAVRCVRLDDLRCGGGIGLATAQIILAEIGTDMSRFHTPEHLVSWAKLCPHTIQSGARNTSGPAGQGNPWLKGALGEAANAAARTGTFLGARYRRIVNRRGHAKALVAVTSTPPAKPATSSASSKPSATKSPSAQHQPDRLVSYWRIRRLSVTWGVS